MNNNELSGLIVCPVQCKHVYQAVPRNSCMPELKREGSTRTVAWQGHFSPVFLFDFVLPNILPWKKECQEESKIPLCSVFPITEANACHLRSCSLLVYMFLLADVTNHTFVNFTDVATRFNSPKVLKNEPCRMPLLQYGSWREQDDHLYTIVKNVYYESNFKETHQKSRIFLAIRLKFVMA